MQFRPRPQDKQKHRLSAGFAGSDSEHVLDCHPKLVYHLFNICQLFMWITFIVLEVRGIGPRDPWMAIQDLRQATPNT